MARNQSSKFGAADGFSFDDDYTDVTRNTEDKSSEIDNISEVKDTSTNEASSFDGTSSNITEKLMEDEDFMNKIRAYQESMKNKPKELGTTRGRKGQKLKRINMAFSDLNYDYITFESRRRGMSATQFVNYIIELYKASPDGHVSI